MLVAKSDEKPKRTYAPIIKPVINDNFDKQVSKPVKCTTSNCC